jgi:UDP-2,3-diacylglucosamine pyrophosphatase LpxH
VCIADRARIRPFLGVTLLVALGTALAGCSSQQAPTRTPVTEAPRRTEEEARPTGTREEAPPPRPTCAPVSDQPRFRALPDPTAPWCATSPEDVTFIHITDTHVGKEPADSAGEPTRDADAFRAVIAAINEAVEATSPRPEFVFITGDLTDTWRPEEVREFKALLKALSPGLRVHVTSGNHDVTFDPQLGHIKSWEAAFPLATLPQVIHEGGLVLIGYDSQVYNQRRKTNEVDAIAEAQWGGLEEAVKAAHEAGKRTFLFSHIPALPNFFRKRVGASWETGYLRRFRRLIARYEVEASITGHFHRDEVYMSGKTLFLNAPPVSRWETRESSFRVVRVMKDGVAYRQRYLGPEAAARSYEVDLRKVTAEGFARWAQGLGDAELRQVWERRYAGDDASERLFGDLLQGPFRAFLAAPFSFQPTEGRTWHLDR